MPDIIIERSDLRVGLRVKDEEGSVGTILNCVNYHNVFVAFDGDDLEVNVDGEIIKCGGSGLYCFSSTCSENTEKQYPLYFLNENDKTGWTPK